MDLIKCRIFVYWFEWRVDCPQSGTYKIKMWGAEGGNGGTNGSIVGAKGGYTEGLIYLTEGEKLSLFVGGKGETGKTTGVPIGGYNGGGNGTYISSVVGTGGAGGGAGVSNYTNGLAGGVGGGLTGGDGILNPGLVAHTLATGGSQTSGGIGGGSVGIGTAGTFGKGGSCSEHYGSGGGGGYYGGGGSGYISSSVSAGAGGSSYISGYTGCVAITSRENLVSKTGCIHYSGKVFTSGITYSGGSTSIPAKDNETNGNGFAIITKQ